MFECIQVYETRAKDEELDAEGPLDGELDCEDWEIEMRGWRRGSDSSRSATSSMYGEAGSPMIVEGV
jgi:hypothetical protein